MKPINWSNIILTWMPWSGKTTIWRKLSKEIWLDVLDFDNDILEKITEETAREAIKVLWLNKRWFIAEDLIDKEVKDLLSSLWEEDFLNLEGFIWENLNFDSPTILSSSWSLPLKIDAMDNLRQNWVVIYIDVNAELILSRLKEMKTDRIIWMWKMSMQDILAYRKNFYDKNKDFNFKVPEFRFKTDKPKEEREEEKRIIFTEFMNFYRETVQTKINAN